MKKSFQPLRLSHTEFADFYGHLCDIICRDDLGIPETDENNHTSKHARTVAMDICDRLANEGWLEYR
jgi:hypothetical protein